MHLAPDYVTLAEDRHAEMLERKEQRRQHTMDVLQDEYLIACAMPMVSINTPAFGKRAAMTPLHEVLVDQLTDPGMQFVVSELIAILLDTERGKGWLKRMAAKHAEYHADDYVEGE